MVTKRKMFSAGTDPEVNMKTPEFRRKYNELMGNY